MTSKEQPQSSFSFPAPRYPTPAPTYALPRMGFYDPGVSYTPLTMSPATTRASSPASTPASSPARVPPSPVPKKSTPTSNPAVFHPNSMIVRKGSVSNVASVSTPIHYDSHSKPSIRTNDDDDWFDGQSESKKKEPLTGFCFKEQKMSPFAPGYLIQNYGTKKFALGYCQHDHTRMSRILPN